MTSRLHLIGVYGLMIAAIAIPGLSILGTTAEAAGPSQVTATPAMGVSSPSAVTSTPVASATPISTIAPTVVTATPMPHPSPTHTIRPTQVAPTPTASKTPTVRQHRTGAGTKRNRHRRRIRRNQPPGTNASRQSAPSPPTVSLPTVAELRQEGRLGNGTMPGAVRRWAYLIIPAAKANGIPPDMVAAVMTVESGGDPLAWNSGSDARGLMQILHGPWDPARNIDVGASMLAGFKQEFHTWRLALAAYNAGPGAVDSYGGVPPFQETQDYVVAVAYLYDQYANQHLAASKRAQLTKALHRYHRVGPHLKHLRPHSSLPPPAEIPGRAALPDGCDPSGGCRPRNLPQPVTDPFWPLGGSSDPLPVVSPSP